MHLRFALSGSIIFSTDADCVPEVGASVVFRTEGYKKGIEAGTLVSATVSGELVNEYDYTDGKRVVVTIDVNPVSPIEEHLPE